LRRTAGAVLLALGALAGSMLFGGLSPDAQAASSSITVGLSALSPTFAVSGDTVRLSGKVLSAAGGSSYRDVQVELKVARLQYRSEMSAGPGSDDQEVFGHVDQLGPLAAGASAPWSFTASTENLGLSGQGVYALDVVVLSNGSKIGALRTYLPYNVGGSSSSLTPTQLVLLWPLTSAPELDGAADESGTVEAADDSLVPELASGGRLSQMLSAANAAKNITFSWVVDPNLLATAFAESNGYVLYPSGIAGSQQPQQAAEWLSTAKSLLRTSGEIWQLPATDPDVASLAQADPAQAAAAMKESVALNGTTVLDQLGRAPAGTLVWPADGQADPATLALAQSIKPAATVVSSASVALKTPDQSYTATGLAKTAAGDTLAVSDAALDQIFAGDSADAAYQPASDSGVLAAQRFLAQTALIAEESPGLSTPRTIMAAAPRDAVPDPDLLSAVSAAPWLKTVGLSTLLRATPDPHAQVGAPIRAATTVSTDLPAATLTQSAQLSAGLQQLTSIMTSPAQIDNGFGPAVLSTLSTAWRTDPAGASTFDKAVSARLDQLIGEVSLVPKSDLTLSGKSGTIPFTIENQLGQPVRVRIQLTTDRDGLTFGTQQLLTVPVGSTTETIHTQATVTGVKITVAAQLVTPTGAAYGTPVSLQVSVSSIGTTALIILGLSAAVLVVAVGLRIYRGRHHAGPGAGESDGRSTDDQSAERRSAGDEEGSSVTS
jgi:Family of unknown function (DUF6049)